MIIILNCTVHVILIYLIEANISSQSPVSPYYRPYHYPIDVTDMTLGASGYWLENGASVYRLGNEASGYWLGTRTRS